MKRFAFAVVVALILALTVSGAWAAQAKVWKIAHIRPAGSEIDKELTRFADELRAATDGRINIQIYGANQLGDYTIVQEKLGLGAVEMSCESVSSQVDKKLIAVAQQYLVSNYAEARRNYGTGAKFSRYIEGLFENQNIKTLAWWPVYFGGIALTKMPAAPTDVNATQNCKVRVPTQKTWEVLAEAFGYQATPLPFSEFFTAAQTGMVDGIFGGGAENYYVSFKELVKCYIPANTHFEVWPLMINMDLYNSLPEADRKVLEEKAKELEERRWVKAEQDQDLYVDLLEKAGSTVVRLTPEQLQAFAEKGRSVVFPELKKVVGDKAYEEILATFDLDKK